MACFGLTVAGVGEMATVVVGGAMATVVVVAMVATVVGRAAGVDQLSWDELARLSCDGRVVAIGAMVVVGRAR